MTEFFDPRVDAEFRERWGLGPEDPVPVSLPKMLFAPDQARNLEAGREARLAANYPSPVPAEKMGFLAQRKQAPKQRDASKSGMTAIVPPSPGWTENEIGVALDKTVDRANFRKKDFFSIPAIENRVELFARSLPGARNDVKARIKGAEASGNFVFGAEAAAAGLSETEALLWARGAQIFQDMKGGKWPTGHDNPGDADHLRDGYRYFHQHYLDPSRR